MAATAGDAEDRLPRARERSRVSFEEAARRFSYDAIVLAPAWPREERCLRDGIGAGGTDWNAILENIRLAAHPVPVRLADESTDCELGALVKSEPDGVLLVGSQGIARALAACTQRGESSTRYRPDPAGSNRGIFVVVGSRERLAVAQARALRDAGWADLSLERPVSQEESDRLIRELLARAVAWLVPSELIRLRSGKTSLNCSAKP